MLCSCGGEIWTAFTPAGPSTVSHSTAISAHRHSKRGTATSPASMFPGGGEVVGGVGRAGGGGGGGPGGTVGSFLPQPSPRNKSPAVRKYLDTAGLERTAHSGVSNPGSDAGSGSPTAPTRAAGRAGTSD